MTSFEASFPWADLPESEVPSEDQHYGHAPIVEAVLEIRCDLPDDVTLESLAQVMGSEAGYGEPETMFEVSGTLDVSGGQVHGQTVGQPVGLSYSRNDGSRAVQVRVNGFSFAWLGNYSTWQEFVNEAWAYWLNYERVAKPLLVNRLGARYINRIRVKRASHVEIKDYLRTAIDVSPYLPQAISGYFLQVQVPLSGYQSIATITSALAPPEVAGETNLILDIDAWRPVAIDGNDLDSDSLLAEFEGLRRAKNYVFEACITDATRGIIR